MEEPANPDQKIPESTLTQNQLESKTLPDISVPTTSESIKSGRISGDLPDDGIASFDESEKTLALEEQIIQPLSPKEETFQVNLEEKLTETPPLLLLESKSQGIEDVSVFSGDLSTMPDQILAEPTKHEELDERTENEIASNIEDQLREFEGSEDEISLDKHISIEPSMVGVTEITRPEDIFGDDVSTGAPLSVIEPTENLNKSASEIELLKEDIHPAPLPTQDKAADENTKLESAEFEEIDMNLSEEKQPEVGEETNALPEDQTQTAITEECQSGSVCGNNVEKSENQEEQLIKETPLNIDDKPPDESITEEEDVGDPLNRTMDFEDVDMRLADDSKEKSDISLDSDDPLSKSDRLDDAGDKANKETVKETLEKESKNEKFSEEMEVDVNSEKPKSAIDNLTDDMRGDDESDNTLPTEDSVNAVSSMASLIDVLAEGDEGDKTLSTEGNDIPEGTDMDLQDEVIEENQESPQSASDIGKETRGSESISIVEEESVATTEERVTTVQEEKVSESLPMEDKCVATAKDIVSTVEEEKESESALVEDENIAIIDKHTKVAEDEKQVESMEVEESIASGEKITVEEETEPASLSMEDKNSAIMEENIGMSESMEESFEKEVSEDITEKVVTSQPEHLEEESDVQQSEVHPDTSEAGETEEIVHPVEVDESEDVCLLPDSEKELTGAEKEQAILARENAEKEAEKSEKAKDRQSDTRQSTPSEEIINEEDHVAEEGEVSQENVPDLLEYDIKELNKDAQNEKCFKCRKTKNCRYKFLRNGVVKFLCDIKCVNSYRKTSKQVYYLSARKIIITGILSCAQICIRCKTKKPCSFRFKNPDTGMFSYVCHSTCLKSFIGKNVEKYMVRRKKYIVEEMAGELTQKCFHCGETKSCKYHFKQDDEFLFICNEDCFNLLSKEEPEQYRLKQRRSIRVRELGSHSGSTQLEIEPKLVARTESEAEAARIDRENSFIRRCAQCFKQIEQNDRTLYWETADFCNELCLGKYQNLVGATCRMCKANVPLQSLGKYCVRFGFDIRQFCCSPCLDRFKKGLKVCSYCQKDMSKSKEGFLAPVGDKGQFKDFCSQSCMTHYDEICKARRNTQFGVCAVCNNDRVIRVEITLDSREHQFCSNPCFSAFKFVNNIYPDQCGMCLKFFERKSAESYTMYQDKTSTVFCCKICMNIYVTLNRKIVPCQWCKVKKYNFDMIQKQCGPQSLMLCSLNCLTLYGVSLNAISMRQQKCDQCNRQATPQYHLTMSDASIRNFCTYQCVMIFHSQFGRTPLNLDSTVPSGSNSKEVKKSSAPFPTGLPKRIKGKGAQAKQAIQTTPPSEESIVENISPTVPIISNVASLAHTPEAQNLNESSIIIKPLRKGRSRLISNRTDSSPPQITPPQPSSDIIDDDQPLVRLRSLRSGTQNIQLSDLPKSQTSSTPPKVIMTNSHTQTKSVQKKCVGITAMMDKDKSESDKRQMQDKSTMANDKSGISEKLKSTEKTSSSKIEHKTQVITVAPPPPSVANKQTMCKPATATKGISCRPHPCSVQCQTDDELGKKILIPIPVPIYVPQPMYMYSAPFPVPIPFPLPIPVPIFIPTTRNSAEGILKEIKKIQDKMPTDPFEAELLMMAEMVAGEKKKNESDSESEVEPATIEEEYQPEPAEPINSFGEDVLQMALKMATECDEPAAVDLESAMTTNTITPPASVHQISQEEVDDSREMQHQMIMIDGERQIIRGRKRPISPVSPILPVAAIQPRNNRLSVTPPNKRQRRAEVQIIGQPEPTKEPAEKPDVNMCLKYTFGVNAWKQWVMTKNADIEKSSSKRKPFKSELLQLTADELNYSLCLFVKEVRKPNGSEYAPDTIYYLVLGIQQYLYENGRIDNIFTDPYYERFTDCLNEVAKKFSILYNDSQYIVTRVEEEHLWECKQLGAHSPHVLLSTLMFFNTKHFNLTTVEEHMQLSFSHIMKHWKRSAPGTKTPGSRNVLLRFYPPQSGLDANPRKKKVYEQQENEENPLRCPVKLYEFYLSKCPESVKTRNDVFYLQPERSCVPDSPVWYSTQALGRDALSKMLHRVKMVKEINIALLTS